MVRSRRASGVAVAIALTVLSIAIAGPFGSANVRAATPTVTVAGTAVAGQPLTINGTGFTAGEYYQVWWDASPTGMPEVRASSTGAFQATITIPATAAVGSHRLTTARRGTTAIVSLTNVSVVQPTTSPTVTVSGTAVAGRPLTINGSGFTAGGYFQVWWDASPTGMPEVQASSTGAFQTTITIPATAATGSHRLTTAKRGTTAIVSLTDVSVVQPTTSPTPAPTVTPAPTAIPTPTPAPTTAPSTGGVYGSAMGADSMGNQQVGGPSSGDPNSQASYRFRAGQTSALKSIRIFIRTGTGYSGGTGGTLRMTVRPDDGTTNHYPTSTVLASTTFTPGNSNPIAGGPLPLITFGTPANLVAGQLYHIVFTNIDPAPRTNYVSVNALWIESPTTPRQPRYSDVDWAQLIYYSGSGWRLRPEAAPTMQLNYANGVSEGMGYMEVWSNGSQTISGSSQVREAFTVRGSNRSASTVSVRLRRTAGTAPLTVRLETGSGSLIEQGSISSVPTSSAWVTYRFATPRTLTAGQTYRLVFSTPSGTSFSIHSIREGSAYGFNTNTYFTDGWAESTTGGSWAQVQAPWGGSGGQADLQFYLR